MRKLWWCLLAILIWPRPVLSQIPGNATIVLFPATPTGNCNSRQLALNESNGNLYTCFNAGLGNQGTWQLIAGGGGGGGTAPGNTLFGNNAISTGAASFFTPGGDVSFSAGNFSVNSLHFGPNALALTNSGIATGNCLQVSGSNLIGGACGTGGGSIPGLSSDGTTLTFVGSGGIVAPKISITQGPLQFTSVTGSLPSPPAVGNNSLVSGTDGWYVSNNGAAFVGPLGAGGPGGSVGPGTVNKIAKFTSTSNVGDSLLTDNGTTVTAPTPATSDDSTQVATTAFVHAAVAAGSGGGGTPVPIPIAHSVQGAKCESKTGGGDHTLSNLNILAGDTVVVTISLSGSTVPTVDDSSGLVYTEKAFQVTGTSHASRVFVTPIASGANAANSVTVHFTGAANYNVCIATYVGVAGYGNNDQRSNSSTTSANVNINTQDNNNFIVGIIGMNTISLTFTSINGHSLAQANTGNSVAMCDNSSPTPAATLCGFSWSPTSGNDIAGIELRCCAMTTPTGPSPYPKTVAYQSFPITASAMASTAVCTTTNCPAGLYRTSFYTVVSTACTAGDLTPHIQYTDEVGLKDVDVFRVGGAANPMTFTAANFGSRSQVFYSTGATAVSVSTVTTACSTGSAAGTMHVTVERLQ